MRIFADDFSLGDEFQGREGEQHKRLCVVVARPLRNRPSIGGHCGLTFPRREMLCDVTPRVCSRCALYMCMRFLLSPGATMSREVWDNMNNQRVKVVDTLAPTTMPGHDPYSRPLGCKPVRLIPVSAEADIGHYYTWSEMQSKVMKVNNLQEVTGKRFFMRLTSGCEYPIHSDDDFQTALKVSLPLILHFYYVSGSSANPARL